MAEPINPAELPSIPGVSQAMIGDGRLLVWISGQVAVDESGRIVGHDDAESQARQCLANIDAVLKLAGASRSDVVKLGVFLIDIADRPAVARARAAFFGDHAPASTLVEVSGLVDPALRVEIEAVAIVTKGD